MPSNALSMIGMAQKAGRVVVGEEPCGIATREKNVRLLLLAGDAADNTRRRCEYFAEVGNCVMLELPDTKAELGGIVGRKSCAMVGVTEIGFASAIVKKLSALNPELYGDVAEKMETKAKRAQERKNKPHRPKAEKATTQSSSNGEYRRDDLRSSAPQRKPYNRDGERKPFNRDGERKPYNRDGERKPYNRDGERKPYNRDGERKPFNRDGERKPYVKRDGDGEQRTFTPGERKSFKGARPVKKGKGSYRKKDNA